MKTIYIETTIPGFATFHPGLDLIISGQQASTLVFWEK